MQTLKERVTSLPKGHWLMIVAPKIEFMLAGVSKMGIMPDGMIKIVYEDGFQEERMGNDCILGHDADDPPFFALVEYVQEGREG